MTVKTKRGSGAYEYVSVWDGTTRVAKSGRKYRHEIRYPIVRGELRDQKSGGYKADLMVEEELQMIGVLKDDRSPDLLLEIVRRQGKISV